MEPAFSSAGPGIRWPARSSALGFFVAAMRASYLAWSRAPVAVRVFSVSYTHLALGLWMVGPGVVESDAEQVEFDLESDAATAAWCAGVDLSLIHI